MRKARRQERRAKLQEGEVSDIPTIDCDEVLTVEGYFDKELPEGTTTIRLVGNLSREFLEELAAFTDDVEVVLLTPEQWYDLERNPGWELGLSFFELKLEVPDLVTA